MQTLTTKAQLQLIKGKVRRFYYATFRPNYVKAQRKKRKGECARCGVCCKLAYHCPSLTSKAHGSSCSVYSLRPGNCRIFPIDRHDLKERNLVAPKIPCGYSFD